MTNAELDLQLAALRKRRLRRDLTAWLRSQRPFDRRAIRVPAERDAYWVTVRRRLAESDARILIAQRATEPPSRP
jgi:hypothetical protein